MPDNPLNDPTAQGRNSPMIPMGHPDLARTNVLKLNENIGTRTRGIGPYHLTEKPLCIHQQVNRTPLWSDQTPVEAEHLDRENRPKSS